MYKQVFLQDLEQFLSNNKINKNPVILYSDFEDFQYQSSLPLMIKDLNKEDLIKFLNNTGHYDKVEITGKGFLSVKFKLAVFEKEVADKKTIIVDYCGVNIAKKMHIGHIRSMFIGDFISRIHENNGDHVVKFNHIGDMGNQFGYLLHYIQKNKLQNSLTNDLLTQYYKAATELKNTDSVFLKESEEIAYKLHHENDEELINLWNICKSISLEDAYKTFDNLNIGLSPSDTQGESFYIPFCKTIIKDLINKGIAVKNEDNSVIVLFDNQENLLIQKSNGNFLYGLYDLAALKWRQENINPDKIVYVVDKRQSLHFQQVFSIAKKAGYVKPDVILEHVGFGSIVDENKKPLKTKSGDSPYLENLIIEGKEMLSTNEYFINMEESIKEEIINKTITGSLKFYDLKFNKNNDYQFKWDYILSASGGSAPYIYNAIVRIDSIFCKADKDVNEKIDLDTHENWSEFEKDIIFQTQKCIEITNDTVSNYQSQAITENLIKICQLFHKYYESGMILGSVDQEKKLKLLNYVYHTLVDNLNLLGIESYPCQQKMLASINMKKEFKI